MHPIPNCLSIFVKFKKKSDQARSVILFSQEVVIRIAVQSQPRQKKSETPTSTNAWVVLTQA
jgi:hypothetical protein